MNLLVFGGCFLFPQKMTSFNVNYIFEAVPGFKAVVILHQVKVVWKKSFGPLFSQQCRPSIWNGQGFRAPRLQKTISRTLPEGGPQNQ